MSMYDLAAAARALVAAGATADGEARAGVMRHFVECVIFAPAGEILDVLHMIADEDWMAMPPWARHLAYRLACLQRPEDAALLREAAADLLSFGPDWDAHAHDLRRRADRAGHPDG